MKRLDEKIPFFSHFPVLSAVSGLKVKINELHESKFILHPPLIKLAVPFFEEQLE